MKGTLREGHPLKEGLRHSLGHLTTALRYLREGHPLKEGLRPPLGTLCIVCRFGSERVIH